MRKALNLDAKLPDAWGLQGNIHTVIGMHSYSPPEMRSRDAGGGAASVVGTACKPVAEK